LRRGVVLLFAMSKDRPKEQGKWENISYAFMNKKISMEPLK
jgi:hypothetical protein